MKWDTLKRNIQKECNKARKDADYTKRYVSYAKKLFDKNLPIIVSPAHLSMLIGMDHQYVCNMANASEKFYRFFYINKSNGKKRKIAEPLPDLKYVQRWILKNILEKNDVSKYAKAFVKNQSLKANARFHRKQEVLVSLDIKDFFPTITVFDVFQIFKEMGYLDNIAWFLANLCCLRGSLPQGAPTSPYISNLRMRQFDNDVEQFIKNNAVRYTRYADDLSFSGSFDPHELICIISRVLYEHGFRMNPDKTRVARQNARQEVTGIVVNDHMQISRQKRRTIRQEVYYIKRYGLDSHLEYIREERQHYIYHLLGQINFAIFVNPSDKEMKGYYEYLVGLIRWNKDNT